MGASESALAGAEVQRQGRLKGVTCIAEAAETQQRILHIPLLCGASTSVDFSTVLGEGSYGVVYGGSVDRSTCRHSAESKLNLSHGSLAYVSEDCAGDSRQSSISSRLGCQYCFSDRTRQVAVKALRHSSQKQQRFFINRFKFLQLIRLQQLLIRSHDAVGAPKASHPADLESATTVSSKEEECRVAGTSKTASPAKDLPKPVAAAGALACDPGFTPAPAAGGDGEGGPCSCCKFLQFPSFESLHLLQVFGVYACSRVSREYLVMEKLSGPTLFGYLCSKYSEVLPKEWEACQIVVPILKGLCCIHQEGFIHGDIKLENIMFRSAVPHPSTLTLVDLDGLTPLPSAAARAARAYSVAAAVARQDDVLRADGPAPHSTVASAAAAAAAACNGSLSSLLNGEGNTLEGLCCTPQYLPVEVVRERKLSPFADLHAVGCICYLLMEGCFPHERVNLKSQGILSSGHICQKLSRDVRYPRIKQKYSPLCENFMRKLLSNDPKYRFSSAGDALRHPWIDYARSLQTPEEKQQERELLRSVLAAAEEAAEKAVEAADKAEEAAREQLEAEAAAAAAAALAAEAAALEAEAALRAAQEAAAAAAAAAKKAVADQKAQQAAAAAAAARAEKARAEQAAEESAAAVVALAECQAAGPDEELQLLLSPRVATISRRSGDGPFRPARPGGVGFPQQLDQDPYEATVRGAGIHHYADGRKQSTAAPAAASERAQAGLHRDDSFCRGAARFVAAARSPRTPRRRGGSVPRTAECGHGIPPAVGGVGGVSYGSTTDSSAFVLLNQQQRAFAKGGAVAAAARPSISGAARSLHLNAAQQAGHEPLLGAPIRRGPSIVAGQNKGPQTVGEHKSASAGAVPVQPSVPCLAETAQRRCRRGGASEQQQLQPSGSAKTTSELHSKEAEAARGMQQVYSQDVREKGRGGQHQEEGEGESPPAWYEGIVSFLEVVGAQSPRGNRLTS